MRIVSLTKAEQVRQAILLQILSGELRPGQRLVETNVSGELGVSQATVNVALQDLHNQGLVTKLLSRSTNVNRYTRREIEDLFAVRLVLEPAAAAAVSARWSNEIRTPLLDQVELMRRAAHRKDIAKFCLADYLFHQEVYRQTANSFLIQACQAIAAAPFAYVLCDHLEALPADYKALAEDHHDLIIAMEQDPETAARATRNRIECWLSHSLLALAPACAIS